MKSVSIAGFGFPRLVFVLAAVCVGLWLPANAALIANWNFDDGNLAPDGGSQAATAGLAVGGIFAPTTSFVPHAGSGQALQLSGGTGFIVISRTLTLSLSGTGLADFVLNYQGAAASGSYNQAWSYDIGGGFVSISSGLLSKVALDPGYDSYTLDLSSINALDNVTSITLRNTVSATGWFPSMPALSFDNVSVNAVPEPVHYALALFGAVFVGVRFGRGLVARLLTRLRPRDASGLR